MIGFTGYRLAAAAAVLFAALIATPAIAQAPAPAPAQATTPLPPVSFKLEGFRSAAFGMTDAQLRAAIRRDFGPAADRITAAENPIDRTTTLTITVGDLLPGGGPAQVVYVLGFSTKKLIQVTVQWGGSVNPSLKVETAQIIISQLRNYLATVGYRPVSSNNANVAFSGVDANERMALLTLSGEAPQPGGSGVTPVVTLNYVLDPRNPDIYRIPRGQF